MSKWIVAGVLASAVPMAASAQMMPVPQEMSVSCPAVPAPLPAELAGWQTPGEMHAAGAAVTIAPGKRQDMMLDKIADVKFTLAPAQIKPNTFGGQFTLKATKAGTYRIALSTGGWIDMVKDGKSLPSTAHGHGPDCSGIHKIVDFALTPGSYTVEISNNAETDVGVLVIAPGK